MVGQDVLPTWTSKDGIMIVTFKIILMWSIPEVFQVEILVRYAGRGCFPWANRRNWRKKNLSPSCTVGFVFIIALNSYSTPTHTAGISNPFYRWGKWGSKRTWLSKEWNRDMNLFPMLIPLISSASVGSCHVCWDSPAEDRGLIQGNILRARETHLHVGGGRPVLKVTLQLLGSWWSVVVYPVPGRDLDPGADRAIYPLSGAYALLAEKRLILSRSDALAAGNICVQ